MSMLFEQGNRRYPDQLNLPSSYMCVLEKDGGILTPPKVLAAFQVRKRITS